MESHNKLADQRKSLRDEIKTKPPSKAGVDQISASDPKPSPCRQPDLPIHPSTNDLSTKYMDELMETMFVGPPLPAQFIWRFESEIPFDSNSEQSESFAAAQPKKHSESLRLNISLLLSLQRNLRLLCKPKILKAQRDCISTKQMKNKLSPVLYREVDLSDLPSQYTQDIETFRKILKLPEPRDNIPMSSTTVWAINDVAGRQKLRPRGSSAMLPVSPQQDFQAANFNQSVVQVLNLCIYGF